MALRLRYRSSRGKEYILFRLIWNPPELFSCFLVSLDPAYSPSLVLQALLILQILFLLKLSRVACSQKLELMHKIETKTCIKFKLNINQCSYMNSFSLNPLDPICGALSFIKSMGAASVLALVDGSEKEAGIGAEEIL